MKKLISAFIATGMSLIMLSCGVKYVKSNKEMQELVEKKMGTQRRTCTVQVCQRSYSVPQTTFKECMKIHRLLYQLGKSGTVGCVQPEVM